MTLLNLYKLPLVGRREKMTLLNLYTALYAVTSPGREGGERGFLIYVNIIILAK